MGLNKFLERLGLSVWIDVLRMRIDNEPAKIKRLLLKEIASIYEGPTIGFGYHGVSFTTLRRKPVRFYVLRIILELEDKDGVKTLYR